MVFHTCPDCNRQFNKKSHYDYHIENKKKPCKPIENPITQILSKVPQNESKNPQFLNEKSKKINIINNIGDLVNKNDDYDNNLNNNINACRYCDKIFSRIDNLNRHLKDYCKSKIYFEQSKKYFDELEELKEKLFLLTNNYQNLENNYQNLVKINQKGAIIENNEPVAIINKTINNNCNNQINKGVILNNTVNIQVVQFGEENIDNLNLTEAVKQYLASTGGNIASNMLKYININEKYPENHNICITDFSREIVKIHNGKKFIYKKFKNVKNDILNKIVKNTRKIVDKCDKDDKIKRSADTKTKLKINDVSLRLIDGESGEEIVREEIKEKEKHLIKNASFNNDSESEEERDFTFEERLRIEHLDKKREGLQIKTFENIKDELYNGKEILEKS